MIGIGELIAKGRGLFATTAQGAKADAALPANADAIADVLEAAATGSPADLVRIQSAASGDLPSLTVGAIALAQAEGWALYYYRAGFTFDNSYGTNPAVSGSPVGSIRAATGEVLGDNILTNWKFEDSTWWSVTAPLTIAGGVATTTGGGVLGKSGTLVSGQYYKGSAEVKNYVAGSFIPPYCGVGGINFTGLGTKVAYNLASTNDVYVYMAPTFSGSIDNVSMRRVLSGVGWQDTTGAKPLLTAMGTGLLGMAFTAPSSLVIANLSAGTAYAACYCTDGSIISASAVTVDSVTVDGSLLAGKTVALIAVGTTAMTGTLSTYLKRFASKLSGATYA